MLHTDSPAGLKHGIDLISVPVFVIDRGTDNRFRIAALNDAHSLATGLLHEDVRGATPHDVLERAIEADQVVENFSKGLLTGAPVSYRETVTFDSIPMTFDTTLHPLIPGDGAPNRLVGTSLRVADEPRGTAELQWFLRQSETALLSLADIIQHSAGGPGTGRRNRAAMAVMVRNARASLDQLRSFTDGPEHIRALLNKSEIPPETKVFLH